MSIPARGEWFDNAIRNGLIEPADAQDGSRVERSTTSKVNPAYAAFELVWLWCRVTNRPQPKTEYRFAPPRRWRFDLAWPELKVAAEFEGGIRPMKSSEGKPIMGHHVHASGYESDCEKYSTAAVLGWRVLRATYSQIRKGVLVNWLEAVVPEADGEASIQRGINGKQS